MYLMQVQPGGALSQLQQSCTKRNLPALPSIDPWIAKMQPSSAQLISQLILRKPLRGHVPILSMLPATHCLWQQEQKGVISCKLHQGFR